MSARCACPSGSVLRQFVKHLQFNHRLSFCTQCGAQWEACAYSNTLCMGVIYVCFVCFAAFTMVWMRTDFQPKKGTKKTKKIFPTQLQSSYMRLQYIKQDRSIGTEKRFVPTIAMLLQHRRPLGLAGCQAAVTHRAVCLFSLPSSWPYGAWGS